MACLFLFHFIYVFILAKLLILSQYPGQNVQHTASHVHNTVGEQWAGGSGVFTTRLVVNGLKSGWQPVTSGAFLGLNFRASSLRCFCQ